MDKTRDRTTASDRARASASVKGKAKARASASAKTTARARATARARLGQGQGQGQGQGAARVGGILFNWCWLLLFSFSSLDCDQTSRGAAEEEIFLLKSCKCTTNYNQPKFCVDAA